MKYHIRELQMNLAVTSATQGVAQKKPKKFMLVQDSNPRFIVNRCSVLRVS